MGMKMILLQLDMNWKRRTPELWRLMPQFMILMLFGDRSCLSVYSSELFSLCQQEASYTSVYTLISQSIKKYLPRLVTFDSQHGKLIKLIVNKEHFSSLTRLL